jgi:Tfp pilus assembly protein PilX
MKPHLSASANKKVRPRATDKRTGFVLIITIILMAFLVLLMVSMASLTRVETQLAANYQQQDRARQHALLSLNIALGQLQKHAGSDQVVTARADILSTTPANTSNFSSYYTGVWAASPAPSNPNSPRPAALKTWLVSGNETTPLARTPADTAAPSTDIFLLDKTVNSLDSQKVRVRKQAIKSTNIPGLPGSITVGNYAYWVGDEGVKAKVTVTDPFANWSATTSGSPSLAAQTTVDATQYQKRLLGVQRYGIEQITTDIAATNFLGNLYDVKDNSIGNFRRDLAKILSYNQLNFLSGFTSNTTGNRFHDLTVESYGLLTNSAQRWFTRRPDMAF